MRIGTNSSVTSDIAILIVHQITTILHIHLPYLKLQEVEAIFNGVEKWRVRREVMHFNSICLHDHLPVCDQILGVVDLCIVKDESSSSLYFAHKVNNKIVKILSMFHIFLLCVIVINNAQFLYLRVLRRLSVCPLALG